MPISDIATFLISIVTSILLPLYITQKVMQERVDSMKKDYADRLCKIDEMLAKMEERKADKDSVDTIMRAIDKLDTKLDSFKSELYNIVLTNQHNTGK